MANQVTVNCSVTIINDKLRREFNPGVIQYSQTTQGADRPLVTVATTDTTIVLEDVTTPGIIAFYNLDPDNYVSIGPDSAGTRVPFMKVSPGRIGLIEVESSSVVLKAIADTAAVKLDVFALEV